MWCQLIWRPYSTFRQGYTSLCCKEIGCISTATRLSFTNFIRLAVAARYAPSHIAHITIARTAVKIMEKKEAVLKGPRWCVLSCEQTPWIEMYSALYVWCLPCNYGPTYSKRLVRRIRQNLSRAGAFCDLIRHFVSIGRGVKLQEHVAKCLDNSNP